MSLHYHSSWSASRKESQDKPENFKVGPKMEKPRRNWFSVNHFAFFVNYWIIRLLMAFDTFFKMTPPEKFSVRLFCGQIKSWGVGYDTCSVIHQHPDSGYTVITMLVPNITVSIWKYGAPLNRFLIKVALSDFDIINGSQWHCQHESCTLSLMELRVLLLIRYHNVALSDWLAIYQLLWDCVVLNNFYHEESYKVES